MARVLLVGAIGGVTHRASAPSTARLSLPVEDRSEQGQALRAMVASLLYFDSETVIS